MKGVVFGTGFLGKRLAEHLGYDATPRSKVDLLDARALEDFLESQSPDVVINAAGRTGRPNIDWCETNRLETFKSNVIAAMNLAAACSERGIYFVHLGSGCIYQGDNGGKGFSETDEPNFFGPQYYANTKIVAEKGLAQLPGEILQLRIRMPIDDRPHERNLIDKLAKYPQVIDVQNSMTTVPHMLDAIKELIAKEGTGIFNLVNPGTISAYEIMELYREIVDPSHEFQLMSLDALNRVTLGKRSNCYLNTDALKGERIELPEIHAAVRECLSRYKTYSE